MYMILSIYKGVNMFDSMIRNGDFAKAINLDFNENFELYKKKF